MSSNLLPTATEQDNENNSISHVEKKISAKSGIISHTSDRVSPQEGDMSTQQRISIGEVRECPDLHKRLGKIYDLAIKRANEVNFKERSNGEGSTSTHTVLTRTTEPSGDEADC